jgi:hypothetical protein
MPRTSLSKYDYGYLRDGGPDWFGGTMNYYGPPHSFWYSLIPWIVPMVRFAFGALVIVLMGVMRG